MHSMQTLCRPHPTRWLLRQWGWALAVLLASCAHPPPPVSAPQTPTAPEGRESVAPGPSVSGARNAREYRQDAAHHLYRLNAERIYSGKLPPLLQAVGVLQLELDARGYIRRLEWMRAPKHVPAVMAEIERTIRAAEPYPRPERLGRVTYTETWLWDRSGRFQLDTLTEGQRAEL